MIIKPTFRKLEIVKKGWGEERLIANNDKYCGKLLVFKAGKQFSGHYHMEKTESFYVLSGTLEFYYYDLTNADELCFTAKEGDIIDIPIGCPHKILALKDTVVVEVSTHHEDTDSFRIVKGDSQK